MKNISDEDIALKLRNEYYRESPQLDAFVSTTARDEWMRVLGLARSLLCAPSPSSELETVRAETVWLRNALIAAEASAELELDDVHTMRMERLMLARRLLDNLARERSLMAPRDAKTEEG